MSMTNFRSSDMPGSGVTEPEASEPKRPVKDVTKPAPAKKAAAKKPAAKASVTRWCWLPHTWLA